MIFNWLQYWLWLQFNFRSCRQPVDPSHSFQYCLFTLTKITVSSHHVLLLHWTTTTTSRVSLLNILIHFIQIFGFTLRLMFFFVFVWFKYLFTMRTKIKRGGTQIKLISLTQFHKPSPNKCQKRRKKNENK